MKRVSFSPEEWSSISCEYHNSQIIDVYYAIVNYKDRPIDYDNFHLCDLAIIIGFSNQKYLSWCWVEHSSGRKGEFQISQNNILPELSNDPYIQIVKMTDHQAWSIVKERTIERLERETVLHTNNYLTSGLIFKDENGSILFSILAIDEPDPYQLPALSTLQYSATWTTVIFDQEPFRELLASRFNTVE